MVKPILFKGKPFFYTVITHSYKMECFMVWEVVDMTPRPSVLILSNICNKDTKRKEYNTLKLINI